MELVKTVRVLVKNKVSTSLKIQGFYYVANTPDFTLKVLTKPTLSIVRCTKEKNKHPLKFNLYWIEKGNINQACKGHLKPFSYEYY